MTLTLSRTNRTSYWDKNATKSKYKLNLLIYRWLKKFEGEGGLLGVSRSYRKFGLNLLANADVIYREWAPAAKSLSLVSTITANVWELAVYSSETLTIGIEMSSMPIKMSTECGVYWFRLPKMVLAKSSITRSTRYRSNTLTEKK